MIQVVTDDGPEEFDSVRFFTDEHNNLCVEDEKERLIRLFRAGFWQEVIANDET